MSEQMLGSSLKGVSSTNLGTLRADHKYDVSLMNSFENTKLIEIRFFWNLLWQSWTVACTHNTPSSLDGIGDEMHTTKPIHTSYGLAGCVIFVPRVHCSDSKCIYKQRLVS